MRQCLFIVIAATAASASSADSGPAPVGHNTFHIAKPPSPSVLHRITASADQGEVVNVAAHLSDQIGSRVANSPGWRTAAQWSAEQFRAWHLANVRSEPFEFGRGWWIERFSVRMVAPRPRTLRAIPIVWTPPTRGPLAARVILAPMATDSDFERWRGRLAGKIVLVSIPRPARDAIHPNFERFSGGDLANLAVKPPPRPEEDDWDRTALHRYLYYERLEHFLKGEGAVAWARISRRDDGIVHGNLDRPSFLPGRTPALPAIELAAEDYRLLARLGTASPVSIEIDSAVHYDDRDTRASNVLADLPGTRPRAGYVMAGAHLDSWAASDGASDDGAGVAIVMEAARILKELGVKPKRTIRFALWGVEEPGFFGSYAYIERHVSRIRRPEDPRLASLWPITASRADSAVRIPGSDRLVAYFNVDNGGGRIRGVYVEGQNAAIPRLKSWLAPLTAIGAATVSPASGGSSDHRPFQRVGVPSFQFIQDDLDQTSLVGHSNLDSFDHLHPDDLRQAAAVLAFVLLTAANADDLLPPPAGHFPSQDSRSSRH